MELLNGECPQVESALHVQVDVLGCRFVADLVAVDLRLLLGEEPLQEPGVDFLDRIDDLPLKDDWDPHARQGALAGDDLHDGDDAPFGLVPLGAEAGIPATGFIGG